MGSLEGPPCLAKGETLHAQQERLQATALILAILQATRQAVARGGWVLAALVLVWLAATAWARPLLLPDEGRYVGVAWEMLRSGNWLTPALDGLPFFHKPPLFYWITAAAMELWGAHVWPARAASLLGAWGGAWALFVFLRRWSSPAAARLSLLVLLVQPLYYVAGQFANLDMLVAGCITATVLCAAHAALCFEHGLPHRRALLAAYALAALGVLAKGLIGGVIPALILLAWALMRRRPRTVWQLVSAPGVLVLLLIAGPWFAAMQHRYPDFLHYFFVVQHFQRFAAGGFNNVQPFWFYPAALLLLSLPWLPWLVRWLRLVRRPLPGNGLPADPDGVRLLMLVWLAVVVGFFSLPASKLLGYVLPAVPPLAFLMAEGLGSDWQLRGRARRVGIASLAVSALAGVVTVIAFSWVTPHSSRHLAAALAAGRAPDEPVLVLGLYPYDLPFYARLRSPLLVLDDWQAARPGDNWRSELVEAGRFAPQDAATTLLQAADLQATLCRSRVSWLITTPDALARHSFLRAAQVVDVPRHVASDPSLLRVDTTNAALASALACGAVRKAQAGPL